MKRIVLLRSIPLCVVVVVSILMTSGSVTARQPSQPAVQAACPHVLRAGVPFAWLRFEPSFFAGFSITLRPGETVQPNDPPGLRWDGSQWWIYVWPNATPGNHGYYWVELNSLEPRCDTAPPPSGMANWKPSNVVRVRQSVPFVWFRSSPTPGNPPIHTVLPGTLLVIIEGGMVDQFNQWWWKMRDQRNNVTGWVEQNTVEVVTTPVSTGLPPSEWQVGDRVQVKRSVPFVWLRFAPSSDSGFGGVTLLPSAQLTIFGGRQFDGVQYWWNVGQGKAFGWVEENSLEFLRRG